MSTNNNKNQYGRWTLNCSGAFACSLLLILLPGTVTADTSTDSTEFRLHVRPSICVSYDSAAPCAMSMLVSWESTGLADVCLQEANQEVLLHCWQNSSQGKLEVEYANTSDVSYWLVDESTRAVLAETEVVVINRDLRDSRKRRRHVWSIL